MHLPATPEPALVLTAVPGLVAQLVPWTAALILLTAVVTKVTDVRRFADSLATYRVLPQRAPLVVAGAVLVVELAAAVSLFVAALRPAALLVTAALFAGYAVVAAVELLLPSDRGGQADCGCLGSRVSLEIGWTHVGMNVVVAIAALLALPVPRPQLLDGTTAGVLLAAAVSLAAIYWLVVYAASVRSLVEDAVNQQAGGTR